MRSRYFRTATLEEAIVACFRLSVTRVRGKKCVGLFFWRAFAL